MAKDYLIAVNQVEHETLINRSRFICFLFPCQTTEQFKAQLSLLKQQHPNANHHCYAFVNQSPDNSQHYGFSDDGEPSGTAGRPMLAVLQGSQVGEVAAIVVRYFGGIKLGTGGLQRAYAQAVKNALENLETTLKVATQARQLRCNYEQLNQVLHLVEQTQSIVEHQDFQEKVILLLAIPIDQLKLFEQQLLTISAGQLVLHERNNELEDNHSAI